jgi:hypothetical protein
MCKQLIYLVIVVLVLGFVSRASAELVAHWKLDEGSGETAFDSSGNNFHGTLLNPVWVPGKIGAGAINTESNSSYMAIQEMHYGDAQGFPGTGNPEVSVCAWIRTSSSGNQFIVSFDRNEYYRLSIATTDSVGEGQVGWHLQSGGILDYSSERRVDDGVWHHVSGVYDNGTATIYIDGEPEPSQTQGETFGSGNLRYGFIGKNSEADAFNSPSPSGNPVEGDVDDVRIYHNALTQGEIKQVMLGVPPGAASEPSPDDQATDVPRNVVLSWRSGDFAAAANGHIVYLSESFNDVNEGIGGDTVSDASYTPPQRLEFGTTYYWRVDEVNAPPDSTIFPGAVWSFTTEPVGYSIDGANIIATASSVGQADVGPENTINGSGLDANDLHSTEATDMWLSDSEPSGAWIQYELDKVYKLHEMWVWNSNQAFEPLFGFGFKDVTVEYSTDGIDWIALAGVSEFARAPGTDGYSHNTTVDFGGAAAQYVKLTATSNWGGVLPQFSLSEVRFFYIPVVAREPSPDSGATGVDVDGTLSWRAGREASMHNVYLSTDEQAVADSNAPVNTVAEASYSTTLELGSTYYWRVDEVNDAETPTTWQGDIWDFTTQQFIVVEDFEDYNDWPPYEIYTTWVDGYEDPANGSQVGHLAVPSVETTIVNSGTQSMPLFYSNTGGATYSEATRTFTAPQNWAQYGIQTLGLLFHGAADNTGQLYVKINGVKVPYDGDAGNLASPAWQPWNIDLAIIGVNLQSVTSLAIGIDGNAAAGTLYIDGIRLYAYARQLVTPVQPDPAGLAAHWQLDGNLNDSSGNGLHGTAMGGPIFGPGKIGQAISLDGVDDYVTIPGYKGIVADRSDPDPNNGVQQPFTVACWINTTGDGSLVCWGSSDGTPLGGQYQNLRVHGGRLRAEHGDGRFRGAALVNDGEWHHVALTVAEGVNIWPPGTQLYVDGQKDTQGADTVNAQNIWNVTADADVGIGVRASHGDRFFAGMFDDVRIYERVLTHEEIAGLAGRTSTFDSRLDLIQD